MEQARPTVDVIIPAYNAAKTLTATVNSVLDQTYPIHKMIIVDDASTDTTYDLMQRFDDPRIVIDRHAQNGGVCKTRNNGFETRQCRPGCLS
jgi:glycosyltransferase involved in cell wall biosynthesis